MRSIKDDDIASWTPERLIKTLHHFLYQKANIARGLSELLADEDEYDSVTDEQKQVIRQLNREVVEDIFRLTEWLHIWMRSNLDDS